MTEHISDFIHVGGGVTALEVGKYENPNFIPLLDAIINGSCSGVITVDASENILMINPVAAAALDVDAVAVIGKSIQDVFPQAGLSEVMRPGEAIINRKIHYRDKTLFVTCAKVQRHPEIGVAFINDFTDRVAVREEVSHTKATVQELESIIKTIEMSSLC
jgi:sensor histidine kinase regulating citrate/malate metabolism